MKLDAAVQNKSQCDCDLRYFASTTDALSAQMDRPINTIDFFARASAGARHHI
ncbi:hypothetical protein DSW25_04425 [Sulfitobacter donghicola DSW-25 = KCTC 12864 = JCM 14565]|uniref:Uncharacterized protein n=1 Tax=Sulfitobacter donghicola DSW-25 = KCTC 12864 = JCM 14565 TaxID=1300350 RepID=A0A073IDP7_9RHOB|nr:hypothetical protein DSW25_04425 [Sulfitobacter donghicola DSW-25 = KCTC 12864 = JCM 14565]